MTKTAPHQQVTKRALIATATIANFAITDHAVIFFFNQDGLLPHERGPLTVTVPRTDLTAVFA